MTPALRNRLTAVSLRGRWCPDGNLQLVNKPGIHYITSDIVVVEPSQSSLFTENGKVKFADVFTDVKKNLGEKPVTVEEASKAVFKAVRDVYAQADFAKELERAERTLYGELKGRHNYHNFISGRFDDTKKVVIQPLSDDGKDSIGTQIKYELQPLKFLVAGVNQKGSKIIPEVYELSVPEEIIKVFEYEPDSSDVIGIGHEMNPNVVGNLILDDLEKNPELVVDSAIRVVAKATLGYALKVLGIEPNKDLQLPLDVVVVDRPFKLK